MPDRQRAAPPYPLERADMATQLPSPSNPTPPARVAAAARLCLRPLHCRHVHFSPPVKEDTRFLTRIDGHDAETLARVEKRGLAKL